MAESIETTRAQARTGPGVATPLYTVQQQCICRDKFLIIITINSIIKVN